MRVDVDAAVGATSSAREAGSASRSRSQPASVRRSPRGRCARPRRCWATRRLRYGVGAYGTTPAQAKLWIDSSVNARREGNVVRAAAVQLNSTDDKDRNLGTADRLTRAAAADGAELIVLPEKFNVLGTARATTWRAPSRSTADPPSTGRATPRASSSIDLVAGSISEMREGREKLWNTSVHVRPGRRDQGRLPQDPHVRRGGRRARVPRVRGRGAGRRDRAVARRRGQVELGLTVCYDLRFPELYRILAVRGARVIAAAGARSRSSPARRTGRS